MTQNSRSLSVQWTQHIKDKAEKEQLVQTILASKTIARELVRILDDQLGSLESQETSLDDFKEPSWEHRQAFRLGQKAQLKKLKELLSFAT